MNDIDIKLGEILETEYRPDELQIGSNGYLSVIKDDHAFPAVINPPNTDNQVVTTDADFARDRMYDVIAQGEAALNLIEKISRESLHPRSLEVMGQLLKTQSDNIDKLLKIQKDKKELIKDQPPPMAQNMTIEKAVFVGSTSDLLKKVRQDT